RPGPPSSCPSKKRHVRLTSSGRCSTIRAGSATCRGRCSASRGRTPPTRSPRSSLPSPLEGRRLWLAGIGGAGMSGYALLAHAWGADVSGWDRVRTPYLDQLPEDITVEIAPDPPVPPEGWETFVSTAFADRVRGRP